MGRNSKDGAQFILTIFLLTKHFEGNKKLVSLSGSPSYPESHLTGFRCKRKRSSKVSEGTTLTNCSFSSNLLNNYLYINHHALRITVKQSKKDSWIFDIADETPPLGAGVK